MTWPFVFQDLVREFITLFVVIDPVGTIPVFLFATAAVPQRLHRSFALRAVLVSALVSGLVSMSALTLTSGYIDIDVDIEAQYRR